MQAQRIHVSTLAALALSAGLATAQVRPDILAVPKDAPPPKVVALGPLAITIESDSTLPKHTIYRPTDLAPFAGGKLPIVAFGNGACSDNGLYFKGFLSKIASHGFLVIVPGVMEPPPSTPQQPGAPIPPPKTNGGQLVEAITWASAEAARPGSRFQGKVAPSKVAVMGQSCGGLMAIEASADPRVKTSVMWNSGVLDASDPNAHISKVTKASLQAFHAPVAYFIGGPTDVAFPNAEDDFKRITKVPVFKGNLNVGHGGTYRQPNGGWFGEVAVNWLAWRLKDDAAAGKMFNGPDCTLCKDPAWNVGKKMMK